MLLKIAFSLFSCLFSIWIFFPGAFTPDTADAYAQVKSGIFYDPHPPLFSIIWTAIEYLHDGPAGMLILHLGCYWLGLFLLGEFGYRKAGISFWWIILPGYWLPLLATFGAVWKDASLLASLSLALGFLALAYHLRSTLILSGVTLTLFTAVGVRYNAFLTVLPLCALQILAYYDIRQRTISRLKASLLTFTYCASLLIMNIIAIKIIAHTLYPSQRIYGYELVAMSVRAEENLLPAPYDDYTLTDLKSLYSPAGNVRTFWADTWPPYIPNPSSKPAWDREKSIRTATPSPHKSKRLPYEVRDPEYNQTLKGAWLSAIQSYPLVYLSHKASLVAYLLGIDKRYVCYPYHDSVIWTGEYNSRGPEEGTLRYRANRVLTNVLFLLRNSLLFRGWFYLCLAFMQLLWCYFFLKSLSQKLLKASLALPLLSLLNIALLTLIAPSCDFRYLIPSVFGCIVFLPCVYPIVRRRTDTNLY